MESTWKSGIERDALLYLRPNPFFMGIVRMLLEQQKVRGSLMQMYSIGIPCGLVFCLFVLSLRNEHRPSRHDDMSGVVERCWPFLTLEIVGSSRCSTRPSPGS